MLPKCAQQNMNVGRNLKSLKGLARINKGRALPNFTHYQTLLDECHSKWQPKWHQKWCQMHPVLRKTSFNECQLMSTIEHQEVNVVQWVSSTKPHQLNIVRNRTALPRVRQRTSLNINQGTPLNIIYLILADLQNSLEKRMYRFVPFGR